MNANDIAVITCDVLSTVCLAILGVGTIAGVQVPLSPWEAVALFSLGKGASTVLSHLAPVGSKRAQPSVEPVVVVPRQPTIVPA